MLTECFYSWYTFLYTKRGGICKKKPNYTSPYSLAGLFPKIGAIINIMPQPVLGDAAVVMFANIVISGINLITKEPLTGRNATIVAIALGLGFGIGSASAVQGFMPTWLKYVFGGSGIVPAALLAIILNIVIPKDKKPSDIGNAD